MCTVTYIPTKTGVILTSNRDEHISRGIALYPAFYLSNKKNLAYPKDRKAGGTWFISNEYGDTGVLLNGAFEKHIPKPPYRKSRGLVLPEIFQSDSPFDALKQYNLSGIENFTIILWEQGLLREIKWDGEKQNVKLHDTRQAHIWSSVTLYDQDMITERHSWFSNWLTTVTEITQADILNFHSSTQTTNKEYGLLISRENQISTSSITSLCIQQQHAEFHHMDIGQNTASTLHYELKQLQNTNIPKIDEAVIAK